MSSTDQNREGSAPFSDDVDTFLDDLAAGHIDADRPPLDPADAQTVAAWEAEVGAAPGDAIDPTPARTGDGKAMSALNTGKDVVSTYVRDRDTDRLVKDLGNMLRRKPFSTALVAAVVGFVIAKIMG